MLTSASPSFALHRKDTKPGYSDHNKCIHLLFCPSLRYAYAKLWADISVGFPFRTTRLGYDFGNIMNRMQDSRLCRPSWMGTTTYIITCSFSVVYLVVDLTWRSPDYSTYSSHWKSLGTTTSMQMAMLLLTPDHYHHLDEPMDHGNSLDFGWSPDLSTSLAGRLGLL